MILCRDVVLQPILRKIGVIQNLILKNDKSISITKILLKLTSFLLSKARSNHFPCDTQHKESKCLNWITKVMKAFYTLHSTYSLLQRW